MSSNDNNQQNNNPPPSLPPSTFPFNFGNMDGSDNNPTLNANPLSTLDASSTVVATSAAAGVGAPSTNGAPAAQATETLNASGNNNGNETNPNNGLANATAANGNDNNNNNMNLLAQLQGSQAQSNFLAQLQVGSAQDAMWQSCRFCQQKYFTTSARLLEHEISCPMHLHVQQFLQAQQAQQAQQQNPQQQATQQQQFAQQGLVAQQAAAAQNDVLLQRQLQMQQNQLQQQFNQQNYQGLDMNALAAVQSAGGLAGVGGAATGGATGGANLGGSNNQSAAAASMLGQFNPYSAASLSNNPFLEQHAVALQAATAAQRPQMPPGVAIGMTQAQAEDQFEAAIDRLPGLKSQQAEKVYPEPKPLTSSDPNAKSPYFPLALPEDEQWLTPLHCFVRKYCVEVFVATHEDVAAPCMGKRSPVSVNQVGIRCPHCSPERMGNDSDEVDLARARENGVVYPSLISRIYNSSINLLQRHLRSCAFVPPEVLARYEELKSSNARSGASKKYWADSATRLGLVDTPDGIRLDKEVHAAYVVAQKNAPKDKKKSSGPSAAVAAGVSNAGGESDIPTLVLPSDKRNTTAFTFHLMSQMQPCVFTEADRLGRRRGLNVGFAGLACRHCFGVYGSGRFFPSSIKTMADASKTLDVIYRHVTKCKNCPTDIKNGLRNLREFHDSERSKMPFGNQRAFFVKIWGRLHENSEFIPNPTNERLAANASAIDSIKQAQAAVAGPIGVPALPQVVAPAGQAAAAAATFPSAVDHTLSPPPALPPALPAVAGVDPNSAIKTDMTESPKTGGEGSPESVHGVIAKVKRDNEKEEETNESMNKMATEAA